jgi:hypothetical protein
MSKRRKPKRAKPPPKCKAILLCERVIIEEGTKNASIISIFTDFIVPGVPCGIGGFTVFVQLHDGIGRYGLTVEVHNLRDQTVIARSNRMEMAFDSRPNSHNVMIPVPPLPFKDVGAYDLVVFADNQEIDRQRFTLKLGDQGSQENEPSSSPE